MAEAVERAKVKLVISDVHGVLTDNTALYNEEGIRSRIFAMKTLSAMLSCPAGSKWRL